MGGKKQINGQHERFLRNDVQSVCIDTLKQLRKIIIIVIIILVLQPGSNLDHPTDANDDCSPACISWGFLTEMFDK